MKCWLISEYGSALQCDARDRDIGTNSIAEVDVIGVGARDVHGTRLVRAWPGAFMGNLAIPGRATKTGTTYTGYRSPLLHDHLVD